MIDKTFEVEGSTGNHKVRITADENGVKAFCDCPAGIRHQLCKHVIDCIAGDAEIKAALQENNALNIFEEYVTKKAEVEKLQDSVARLKKKLAKSLLGAK